MHGKDQQTLYFFFRPPIPNRPRLGRLDLCLWDGPGITDFVTPLSNPRPAALPIPGPTAPALPEGFIAGAPRGVSGRPDRSLDLSAAAAESAAVRVGLSRVSEGSREWRWEACERRARSWTDLNLSRRSTQRMVFSSRVLRRVPEDRSNDDGAV
jgi:hypothetical protein